MWPCDLRPGCHRYIQFCTLRSTYVVCLKLPNLALRPLRFGKSWSTCYSSFLCMFSIHEPPHDKTNKMTVRPARVFAVCMKKARVLSYPLSTQRRLWSDWADTQADLSLHWAHMPVCWFCHEAAHTCIIVSPRFLSVNDEMFWHIWLRHFFLERIRVVSPTFHFAPSRFAPMSFRPLSRSPLSLFAHFPVRPWVVSPPYKILFLVLLFQPKKWYKALFFLAYWWFFVRTYKRWKKKTEHFIRYFEK